VRTNYVQPLTDSALDPRCVAVADKMRFGPVQSPSDYETLPPMGTVATLLVDAGFTLTDVEIVSESVGVPSPLDSTR